METFMCSIDGVEYCRLVKTYLQFELRVLWWETVLVQILLPQLPSWSRSRMGPVRDCLHGH